MATKSEKAVYELIINGELAGKTLKDLEGALRSVRAQAKLTNDPAEMDRLAKAYQNINSKIVEHNNHLKGTGGMWSRVKTEVKQFGMIAAGYLGFQFITGQIQNLINGNAKLSDSLADVRKTTGLTNAEVMELNAELKKLDTRTSRSELLKLAKEAGKLGYESVGDVKKFVEQADKIKVALGEDLGEDAVIKIAKLSKIFKSEMTNIASAINEVGASSEASEQYQVDFLSRTAGISQTAKLAAADMMGFSAALEINGQTAEVSGTAINSFFIDFIKKADEFGEIAGMARGELSKLMSEKGTNAAFLEFLTKLKEGSPSAQSMLNKLQQLGVDGTRGAGVLLTLANNVDLVKKQQLIANDAFTEGSSIIKEFNTRNETFGAVLDKISKRIASWFISTSAIKGMESLMRGFLEMISDTSGKLMDSWRDQKSEVEKLEKSYIPLIDRYDQLKEKGELNNTEQAELNTIIGKIAQTIPESISQFDKYGKAMAINTSLAREFILTQRLIAEQKNKDALKDQRAALFDLRKELEAAQTALNRRNEKGQIIGDRTKTLKRGGEFETVVEEVVLTGKEIESLAGKVQKIHSEIQGREGLINELIGDPDYYKNVSKEITATTTSLVNDTSTIVGDGIDDINEKARSNTEKLKEELAKMRAEAIKDEMAKEEAILNNEYISRRKKIATEIADKKVKSQVLSQLYENYQSDLEDIWKKHADKRKNAELNQDLKNLEDWYSAEKLALKKSLAERNTTQEIYEADSAKLQQQYLTLKIKNLQDYGQSTVEAETKLYDLLIQIQTKALSEQEKRYSDLFKKFSKKKKQEVTELLAQLMVMLSTGVSITGDSIDEVLQKIKNAFAGGDDSEFASDPAWMNSLRGFINEYMDEFNQFASSISSIWSSINQKEENRDKKRLDRIHQNFEKEKKGYDRLLQRKMISQTDYNNQVQKLEEDKERQERKVKRDAAIRQQKLAIFNATINAIQGIAMTLSQYSYPINLIFAALHAVAAYAQVSAIKSEPLPELRRGKRFTGIGKHPVSKQEVEDPSGNRFLVEADETLLSAATYQNNPDLVDALLEASMNNEGKLKDDFALPYIRDSYPQVNVPRIIETSQIDRNRPSINPFSPAPQDARAIVNNQGPVAQQEAKSDELLTEIRDLLRKLSEEGVEANLSYPKFKKNLKRLDNITGGKVY